MLLSLRGYAGHRGCALSAVQKAIKAGRIKLTAAGKVDSEQADRDWRRNTDPAMARGPIQPPMVPPPTPQRAPRAANPVPPSEAQADAVPVDVDFEQVERQAAVGSAPEDIIRALGLPAETLRNQDFRAAVERGRNRGKLAVLEGQFRAAQEGKAGAVKSLAAVFDTPLPEVDDEVAPDGAPEVEVGHDPAGPDFQKSRAAKEQYLAELRRLELEQKQGDLVQLAVVNAWVAGMIIRAATILDRIPDEFADRLSQETDPVVIRDLLRTELGRARNELAEYKAAC